MGIDKSLLMQMPLLIFFIGQIGFHCQLTVSFSLLGQSVGGNKLACDSGV